MTRHTQRWSVSLIRKKAEQLGTVSAPDEKAAIEMAAEEFKISPEHRNRIVVSKVGSTRIASRCCRYGRAKSPQKQACCHRVWPRPPERVMLRRRLD